METVFLDLRNFDAERAQIRRLEKNLSKSPEYIGKKGRVLFFRLTPEMKVYFYKTIIKGLLGLGYKCEICYMTEKELT